MWSSRLTYLMSTCISIFLSFSVFAAESNNTTRLEKDDGYRGIWYAVGRQNDQFRYKYSGGLGTYPQQHIPIAYYSEKANKTFFCYGGSPRHTTQLLIMVSYYDHATGKVPRPSILLNKKTSDSHDNPTLIVDDNGYLWIFSNSHGGARPAYIHKSTRPYSIDEFQLVRDDKFSYSQPWYIPSRGCLFLHTRYQGGRRLFWMTSPDGIEWSEPGCLSRIAQGHYQVSWGDGKRVGTAFNYHPRIGGLDARTNLYYVETRDFGASWRTVDGTPIETPITTTDTLALVHDYESVQRLVYLKEVQFDDAGYPVILYLTSGGSASGPQNDPRTWYTAQWTGTKWEINPFTTSDHNYDFGSFYIEPDGTWRIIAPTETGPQPYNTGGEIAMWISCNKGKSWKKIRDLTRDSRLNHTYVRHPVHAHPDFYAFWADGHGRQLSNSNLYFTDKEGTHVWRLPSEMTEDFAEPEIAW